jgi:hypothetical protein
VSSHTRALTAWRQPSPGHRVVSHARTHCVAPTSRGHRWAVSHRLSEGTKQGTLCYLFDTGLSLAERWTVVMAMDRDYASHFLICFAGTELLDSRWYAGDLTWRCPLWTDRKLFSRKLQLPWCRPRCRRNAPYSRLVDNVLQWDARTGRFERRLRLLSAKTSLASHQIAFRSPDAESVPPINSTRIPFWMGVRVSERPMRARHVVPIT